MASSKRMSERLKKPRVPSLENILGKRWPVLDDGFVRVVDYLGDDAAIVQAARISYGAGTKTKSSDSALIRYLMRHGHTTPFEMCEIKLHVRVPMDTWRQWIRHRTASVNEYSTRYSVAIDAAARTAPDEWRLQSQSNRQGSNSTLPLPKGVRLSRAETKLLKLAQETYQERIALGIAREQARKDLPLSTYTEAYWKVDLHNLLGFLKLRMDAHAQKEIRSFANTIGNEVVARWCPIAWRAFVDYRLGAVGLSRIEVNLIRLLSGGDTAGALRIARQAGWVSAVSNVPNISREGNEAAEKLALFGLTVPWSKTTLSSRRNK